MDFLLSDDLREFSASLQKFLANNFSSKELRSRLLSDHGAPPQGSLAKDAILWASFSETGALAASLEEEFGGLGFGILAAQAISELCGKFLCPLPVTETILSASVLSALGSESAKKQFLPQVATGEMSLSGVFQDLVEKESQRSTAPLTVTASQTGSEYQLSGVADFAPSAESVSGWLIPAMLNNSRALFFVDRAATKTVKYEPLPTFDLLRPYYRTTLSGTPAQLLSANDLTQEAWSNAVSVIAILTTAEMIGAASTAFAMSLDYSKTRVQFGQPIGRFQAISHKLSNMYVELEAATSLNRFAAHCATNDPSQLTLSAAASKGLASETLPVLVQEAIQVHGGIGFTFEYDLHLYLRRVRVLSSLYGSAKSYYRRTAEFVMAREESDNSAS